MTSEAKWPSGVREGLAGVTRRLDDLAASLARLGPAGPSPVHPVGEVLDEAERAELVSLGALLAIGPGLGHEEALVLAVDRAIHGGGADCAAIFLPTVEDEMEAVAPRGFPPGPLRARLGEGIVGRAFIEREIVRAGPEHQARDPLLRDHALGAGLAVPIHAPGQPPAAVLFAGRRRAAPFRGDAIETLLLVADRAASLLAAAPGPGGAPRPELILDVDLDLGHTAETVVRQAAARLGAPCAALLLPDEGRLRLVAARGLPPGAAPPDPAAGGLAAAGRSGQPWVTAWEGEDEALAAFLGAPRQLVVPLVAGGRTVGLLVAGGPAALAPAAVADLVGPAATAIRHARLYGDTVAGLAERRATTREDAAPPPQPVRDFANLLAVVLARIALARERIGDAAVGHDLDLAEEAAWRAAEAVRGFLGFAPGHRGGPLVPLDLGEVVRGAVETAGRRWAARHDPPPKVHLDLEPTPPVRGSADDLREALDHLLENAAEAVPAGGDITVRTRWDGARRAELIVEDRGAGMDDQVRAQALDPFFSTRGPGRLGLGLPVAQAIVARHRGTLDLESRPGEGTTVRITLPTAAGPEAAAPAPPRP